MATVANVDGVVIERIDNPRPLVSTPMRLRGV